jgi:hypothetical protein
MVSESISIHRDEALIASHKTIVLEGKVVQEAEGAIKCALLEGSFGTVKNGQLEGRQDL